jgi:hypothetical protein
MNFDDPKESLRLRWSKVPPAITGGSGVEAVKQYKAWLIQAQKTLSNKSATRTKVLSLINQYDSWK